jgi:hypothetical protein
VELGCAPFLPKNPSEGRWRAATKLPMIGREYSDKNEKYRAGGKTAIGDKWYITGLEGRAGENMDCLGWYGSDFAKIHDVKWKEPSRADCCAGKITDKAICGPYQPDSAECSKVMKSYCRKADNIAKNACQNVCRQDKSIECDTAMIEYCRRQKEAGLSPELCNCINSESLAPQCWDPMCSQTAAYQTLNQLSRQDCGVFCSQEINVAETQGDVGIDRTLFEQKCGRDAAKKLEDAISPSPPDDPDTAELEAELRQENPDITEEEIQVAKDELRATKLEAEAAAETTGSYWIIVIVAILVFTIVMVGGGLWLYLK